MVSGTQIGTPMRVSAGYCFRQPTPFQYFGRASQTGRLSRVGRGGAEIFPGTLPSVLGCWPHHNGRLGPRLHDGFRGGSRTTAEGHRKLENTGAALHLPTWGAHLAEALLLADVTDEAATVLEDALALAYKNGDVFMLAELHRLRGRLHVRLSRVAEAETEFLRAREVGGQQEAKLFELRATSDLAQLWVDQGYVDRAAELLSPVFDSFTEGLDTPDLLQARHLLERLSRH